MRHLGTWDWLRFMLRLHGRYVSPEVRTLGLETCYPYRVYSAVCIRTFPHPFAQVGLQDSLDDWIELNPRFITQSSSNLLQLTTLYQVDDWVRMNRDESSEYQWKRSNRYLFNNSTQFRVSPICLFSIGGSSTQMSIIGVSSFPPPLKNRCHQAGLLYKEGEMDLNEWLCFYYSCCYCVFTSVIFHEMSVHYFYLSHSIMYVHVVETYSPVHILSGKFKVSRQG